MIDWGWYEWYDPDSLEEELYNFRRYSPHTDWSSYRSSEYSRSEVGNLLQVTTSSESTWNRNAEVENKYYFPNKNITDNLSRLDSYSSDDDASYEKSVCSSVCSCSVDDDSSQDGYIQSTDIDCATEIDNKCAMFTFYKKLTKTLLRQFSIGYSDIKTSVKHMINNYRQVSYGILPLEIDYTKKPHCVGYLHRYAACHAAMVFDAVTDMLDPSYSDALWSKLGKKSLNVIFLGCGPGNDFVGFLTALCSHHHHLFDLDVTVVDKMSGWEQVFNETVENLRNGGGGKAGAIFEEVNISTTFILADLKDSEGWSDIMHFKLRNADIVFFVKVLSFVPDGDKLQVLQNVVDGMKLESHLVYIDYPYPYSKFSRLSNHLKTVYQGWEARYILGYKECTFGCNNIVSSRAVVKVFEKCEVDY